MKSGADRQSPEEIMESLAAGLKELHNDGASRVTLNRVATKAKISWPVARRYIRMIEIIQGQAPDIMVESPKDASGATGKGSWNVHIGGPFEALAFIHKAARNTRQVAVTDLPRPVQYRVDELLRLGLVESAPGETWAIRVSQEGISMVSRRGLDEGGLPPAEAPSKVGGA